MMERFFVVWEMEFDGESPLEAAISAKQTQEDTESLATVFRVWDRKTERWYVVDLGGPDDDPTVKEA